MNISMAPVSKDEKEILKNLLEKYEYEFSQYNNCDVNSLGLYGYDYLDYYWTEENRFIYFIKADDKLAGFVMISDYPEINIETNYSVSEFFVMHKYRKSGIGTFAAKYIFDKYKGAWQLRYHPENRTSKLFWNKVVREYTNGNYKIIENNAEAEYEDGTIGEVLIFKT
ncbi:GNAT family N-acetyltransferase [Brucepastera parasyntrophica]|uniref:GNAT family N-acetyltransferase n=1 Tax=Brucepastera parasyntrophica TaxID=2880008 RepID=UPI00210BDB63|nr:GNAT family N-acetyltransferase [Brucepastera parasyntrophica]ULQ58630.1 GNAT family N-acetyltransferase [Brucepastera parasyntrophica]